MPPSIVKTIRDQIFWQYAKFISKSAGFGIDARPFQMKKFIELRDCKITWSSTIREWVKEHEKPNECVYCGATAELTIEHILPCCCGGPDVPDNAVKICKKCNSTKGGKRLYEWKTLKEKDSIPRIAEGKYLKLLYELHEKKGTLLLDKTKLTTKLCPFCDMKQSCAKEGKENILTVYCLEGIFRKEE